MTHTISCFELSIGQIDNWSRMYPAAVWKKLHTSLKTQLRARLPHDKVTWRKDEAADLKAHAGKLSDLGALPEEDCLAFLKDAIKNLVVDGKKIWAEAMPAMGECYYCHGKWCRSMTFNLLIGSVENDALPWYIEARAKHGNADYVIPIPMRAQVSWECYEQADLQEAAGQELVKTIYPYAASAEKKKLDDIGKQILGAQVTGP